RVGDDVRRVAAVDPQQEGVHVGAVTIVEAILDRVGGERLQIGEGEGGVEVLDAKGVGHLREKLEAYESSPRVGRLRGVEGPGELGAKLQRILVVQGGEDPELPVLHLKVVTSLPEAALAHENRDLAGGERLLDRAPLLQGLCACLFHLHSAVKGSSVTRASPPSDAPT